MNKPKLSRQRLWQLKKKKQGLCIICGKPATKNSFKCEKHKIMDVVSHRKLNRKKFRRKPYTNIKYSKKFLKSKGVKE